MWYRIILYYHTRLLIRVIKYEQIRKAFEMPNYISLIVILNNSRDTAIVFIFKSNRYIISQIWCRDRIRFGAQPTFEYF